MQRRSGSMFQKGERENGIRDSKEGESGRKDINKYVVGHVVREAFRKSTVGQTQGFTF